MKGIALLLSLVAIFTTGCSSLEGTGDKGYISGDGQITTFAPAERGEPISLTGEDLDGNALSLDELRGQVVVVNYWWSGCPPCRVEQPHLTAAAEETEGVAAFVGLNIRNLSPDPARAFVRTSGMPYPSFYDPSGQALLAFSGVLPRNAIPSTVVLDKEGRVAATVIGAISGSRTLPGLIADAAGDTGG